MNFSGEIKEDYKVVLIYASFMNLPIFAGFYDSLFITNILHTL
jgi:hypothetical protein